MIEDQSGAATSIVGGAIDMINHHTDDAPMSGRDENKHARRDLGSPGVRSWVASRSWASVRRRSHEPLRPGRCGILGARAEQRTRCVRTIAARAGCAVAEIRFFASAISIALRAAFAIQAGLQLGTRIVAVEEHRRISSSHFVDARADDARAVGRSDLRFRASTGKRTHVKSEAVSDNQANGFVARTIRSLTAAQGGASGGISM